MEPSSEMLCPLDRLQGAFPNTAGKAVVNLHSIQMLADLQYQCMMNDAIGEPRGVNQAAFGVVNHELGHFRWTPTFRKQTVAEVPQSLRSLLEKLLHIPSISATSSSQKQCLTQV